MGMIPKETKAENKQAFNLTLNKIMGLLFTIMMAVQCANLFVHSRLNIIFVLWCVAVYAILNMKAPAAANKNFWQGLLIWMVNLFTRKQYKSVVGYEFEVAFNEHASKTKKG